MNRTHDHMGLKEKISQGVTRVTEEEKKEGPKHKCSNK